MQLVDEQAAAGHHHGADAGVGSEAAGFVEHIGAGDVGADLVEAVEDERLRRGVGSACWPRDASVSHSGR
ncbi:MAG: hypothetical protein H6705_02620 [Myxococcales bacterium]|nr:hypothetical protein [Myxococcales bacterium]